MNLDALVDELAIRTLTASYTDAMNRSAVDEAMEVYADDGVLVMMDRAPVHGKAAIADALRGSVVRYQLLTQMLHSSVVQLDGDLARARWQVTESQILLDGTGRLVIGRYEDDLVRTAAGWRFARRTFTARYLGPLDLSADVLPDRPVLFPLWP